MTDLADQELVDILPASIRDDDQVQAMAKAIQSKLDAIDTAIPTIELYGRIDELPEPILRMLAWEHRVYRNEWALATTIEAKRELVRNAYELNKRRGTRQSIERVFQFVNFTAELEEWFEYGSDPYYFRINILDVSEQGLSQEQLDLLKRLVDQYKPARAFLESIGYVLLADAVTAYHGEFNTMTGALNAYAFIVQTLAEQVDALVSTASSIQATLDVRPDTT